MSKQYLNGKMDRLPVPQIKKMNSPMASLVTSDDEEIGLGYHHTLVSWF
jgi:hypothetical protein